MDNLTKARRKPPPPLIPPPSATANARLCSLSMGEQLYIAEKYYGGKMPWREEGRL